MSRRLGDWVTHSGWIISCMEVHPSAKEKGKEPVPRSKGSSKSQPWKASGKGDLTGSGPKGSWQGYTPTVTGTGDRAVGGGWKGQAKGSSQSWHRDKHVEWVEAKPLCLQTSSSWPPMTRGQVKVHSRFRKEEPAHSTSAASASGQALPV